MAKMLLTFLAFWGLIAGGSLVFYHMSGKEKLKVLKVVSLSALFAVVAVVLLGVFVMLF